MSVNKVILLGRLGKDPLVKHLDGNRAVARFSIATNEVYRNKQGEKEEKTEWVDIVAWSPQAEIVEKYLKSGSQVYIEGKLTSSSYDDKEGIKRYRTEVSARELVLLGSPSNKDGSGTQPTYEKTSFTESAATLADANADNDLPF